MIIDADTHISPTGEDANAITWEELIRRMDDAGVDRALTWLRPPYMRDITPSNRYVFEAVRASRSVVGVWLGRSPFRHGTCPR